MKKIIYHHPLPLADNPKSGSQVRPIKMLNAFKELGYEVDLVSGYSTERKEKINIIKNKIRNGTIYDFMYCENSTMPTQLTDQHHLPLHPFLDFDFFSYVKKNNIPIGLFYRDIFWRFELYEKGVSNFKAFIAKFFYIYELNRYNKLLDILYLPSTEMKKYIPEFQGRVNALPPGHSKNINENYVSNNDIIRLTYVGGFSDYYDLTLLIKSISHFKHIELTICTREIEWENAKHKYQNLSPNIKIVHLNGDELLNLYKKTDIAVLFVRPQEYWNFAVPIKLFEYIGEGKPILVSKGTFSANFVEKNNIGWVVDYSEEDVNSFLNCINFNEIDRILKNVSECASTNSWKARALQVVDDLKRVH